MWACSGCVSRLIVRSVCVVQLCGPSTFGHTSFAVPGSVTAAARVCRDRAPSLAQPPLPLGILNLHVADCNNLLLTASAFLSAMTDAKPASMVASPADIMVASEVEHIRQYYSGVMQTRRLLYIAQHAPTSPATTTAWKYIADSLHHNTNISLLQDALTTAERSPPPVPLPVTHGTLATLDTFHNNEVRGLDGQLQAARRDGDRLLIFSALSGLAECHVRFGDYNNALLRWLECREWATSARDVVDTCMRVVHCSVMLGSLSHVKSQVQRVRAIMQQEAAAAAERAAGGGNPVVATKEDDQLSAQLEACLGLFALKTGAYQSAAMSFLSVTSALSFSSVISLRDCTILASLCALASFSRSELRSRVLSNSEWRKNVDSCSEWRTILSAYIDSDYNTTFQSLTTQHTRLALLPPLTSHLPRLLRDIRGRAVCQYFIPYTALQLSVMASGLSMDVVEVEAMVGELIGDGRLQGRIDKQRGLLVKKGKAGRKRMYESARRAGEKVVREGRGLMMRMSLIECDITLQNKKRGERDAAL